MPRSTRTWVGRAHERLIADFIAEAHASHDAHAFRLGALMRLERLIGFDSAIFIPISPTGPPATQRPALLNKQGCRSLFAPSFHAVAA